MIRRSFILEQVGLGRALFTESALKIGGWGIFIFFGALSLSVHWGWWRFLDVRGMRFVQSFASTARDCAAVSAGWTGSPEITGLATLLLAGYFLKKDSWARAAHLLGVFAVITIIEIFGKLFIFQPPPIEYHRFCAPGIPSAFVTMDTPNSYPSGHMLRIAFLIMLALKWGWFWRLRWLLGVLGVTALLAVAVTRVYIGDHWPSDVLGGILLAALGAVWIDVEFLRRGNQ